MIFHEYIKQILFLVQTAAAKLPKLELGGMRCRRVLRGHASKVCILPENNLYIYI